MASTVDKPKGFYSSGFWTDYLSAQRSKLPFLQECDNISDRVVRFLGGNPGDMQLQGTNTYLVGTGDSRILIDTGEGLPQWARNVTRYLEDHDLSISHILLTHWHGDHTGGVADILAHDPSTRVYKAPTHHAQALAQEPDPIHDGQVFQTQGATLKAVLTPGHTTDHTCFVLAEEKALFTGDNVLGHGYSVAEDLGRYTASLRRMAGLGCAVGYPGHGSVIPDLPRKIACYVAQREARERRVYESLLLLPPDETRQAQPGGLSTAEIALLLYGDIVASDTEALDVAVKPLLGQVLGLLLERGEVGVETKMVGRRTTTFWFARARQSRAG